MRYSNLFAPTLKEAPSDAEIKSHEYLVRGAFIRKVTAGVYNYLPLGKRVLDKIWRIVKEEMDNIGAQEMLMPIIQPAELWKITGRWDDYGPTMMKLHDRHEREFTLGPTHEEVVTFLMKSELSSYKQLPVTVYQIANKYRDELRPRYGLLRAREFIMKDAYSFHSSWKSLDEVYQDMRKAYEKIMERTYLKYLVIEAASGAIGGNQSHEFVSLAPIGESNVLYCEKCGYQASDERTLYKGKYEKIGMDEEEKELERVETPNVKTVEQVANFLGVDKKRIVKSLLYVGRKGMVMALIRGDLELNEEKLKEVLNDQSLRMATPEEVLGKFEVPIGFIGPVGVKDVYIIADHSVKYIKNAVVGGMKEDTHYVNVNLNRDFKVDEWAEMRMVKEGDPCPVCGAPLKATKGIELGHIFKLGTKYSEAMKAYYMDEKGELKPFIMGCYGWGVSRTLSAIVEQYHDDKGIIWPISVAPYTFVVTIVNMNKKEQVEAGEKIYKALLSSGEEVLLDDRMTTPGIKFNDADLIGFPIRITVGKALKEGKVEVKMRHSNERIKVDYEEDAKLIETLKNMKESYKPEPKV
ncbi:MAG: proline--tRNA ligase [Thermotogaceae bacterium]|nr:proline--tRNA ligase [Thermotogaceae bacterium]